MDFIALRLSDFLLQAEVVLRRDLHFFCIRLSFPIFFFVVNTQSVSKNNATETGTSKLLKKQQFILKQYFPTCNTPVQRID